MNRLSKITARAAVGVGAGALLVLFSGDRPAARQRLQPGGDGVLIASEPLADSTGAICLWPTDWQVDDLRARRATALRLEQQGRRGRSATAPGGEVIGGDPLRMVRDPNAAFAAVAVDVARNEVIATDENLFQILAFKRTDNTADTARTAPVRTIAGEKTQIEFQSGVYVDPESGDIYATNNDTRNKMAVFAHGGNGDVAPVRLLETPHGAFGITVDKAHAEMLLTIQHDSAIVTYRKQADGKESPIRLLQGSKTGIADPHGIVIDPKDDVFFVANYGSTHDASATIEKRTGVPSGGQDVGKTNWPLGREYAIPGSGSINAPSIVVHKRTDSGNAPAVRVIQGPATQLDWPTGLAFDAERRELFVANDAGSSVLVFDANASGNTAPKRVLKGPKTNLANPTSVFADGKNGELWVANFGGHTITVYPLTASGNTAPTRTIRSAPPDAPSLMIGNPGAVAFDSTRDELLVPN
jgi:DNA-binding beta-propeller fold protein YncE